MLVPATTPLAIATSILALVAGLVLTFSGYRLARSLATIAGFITGFVIGLGLGAALAGPVGALVGAIVLGIALALLFRFAFRFAGAVVGALAGMSVAANLGWPIWALVVAAIVGGVAGLLLNKIAIVTFTALVGASLAVKAGAELLYGLTPYYLKMEVLGLLLATIVLASAGILSQMRSLRGEDEAPGVRGSAS
ncbi:MAG: hypothetical protein QOE90_2466 [Thermoplasmata archaeon]|jgi:hypothetical protein|nr:hypothetical protein [Thermoplasmata archaeon]